MFLDRHDDRWRLILVARRYCSYPRVKPAIGAAELPERRTGSYGKAQRRTRIEQRAAIAGERCKRCCYGFQKETTMYYFFFHYNR